VEPEADARLEDLAERVQRAMQMALSFKAEVRIVAPGALPRFEMKAHRFVRGQKRSG
jgi:phenylacetate-coenzyme A ligase PaaK-like adenylate-forming protein